ncbi:MAG: VWA domain-containing protein [Dehalococcoidia bacterium]|nr:VWA domain-containing protein [Dehalococcoidia bacterium]
MSGLLAGAGFGQPWLLAGLVMPVLALVAVIFAARRRRFVSRLLGGASALRGGQGERLRLSLGVLAVAAVALAVLAGARPQWGEDEEAVPQQGIDVIIALDVSRSMEAEDVTPSRARAAAAGLAEMLTHMTGNRVGLVVFAGDAFPRAPLTVDLPVVTSLIARAQAEAPLVRPGTNFREALAESFRLLDVEDAAQAQAILLVSDGEDLSSDFQDAVDFAERRGIRVYTVFAGTSNPTALPEASGGTDVSVAQPDVLQAIAEQTGASFRTSERIPGLAVDFRRLQQTQFAEGTRSQPIDRFAWFAGAAAALLLVATMLGEGAGTRRPQLRGGLVTAAFASLVALLLVGCGSAAWQHVRAGNDAYEADRFEEALDEYRQAGSAQPEDAAINYDIAVALNSLNRLDESIASAEQARAIAQESGDGEVAKLALYTLGNTYFRQSNLEGARDAYRAALRIDPSDQDAKANLELVMQLLAPPDAPDEPPPPGSGDTEQGEDGGGDQPPGEGDEPGTPGAGEPSDGQPGESGDQPGGDGDTQQPAQPGAGPGEAQDSPAGSSLTTLEEVQSALEQALGELGPEVSLEEALRILELSQRANELNPLPSGPNGSTPPR